MVLMVACPEEIAYCSSSITAQQLETIARPMRIGNCREPAPVPGLYSIESRSSRSLNQSGAWDAVGRAVQPGCTNLGLSALFHSRSNAGDDGRIGCSQARSKTEYKWGMESVAHTLIIASHTRP
jgi:hypothetical protein